MATEYLRKPLIIKRIDEILDERGFTDETVKREHFNLIKNGDEAVKMRAIDSYYKLKGKNEEKAGIVVMQATEELIEDKVNDYLDDIKGNSN
jgi:hypothetical protein